MTYQFDSKSIFVGFLATLLVMMAVSFKSENNDENGRYKTSATEAGVVILDTKTGAYIINTDYTNGRWKKGDFTDTHGKSRAN